MALLTRGALKSLFKRGMVPTEVNFADLIDSSVNKIDDGFAQSSTHGFMLSPQGSDQKLISFFESIRDEDSAFNIRLNPDRNSEGLGFEDKDKNSVLFLRQGGNVGINTTRPRFQLEVNGMTGMRGRIGTYEIGRIVADKNWHVVLPELDGSHAFEIIAYVAGRPKRGKYGLTHATAVATHGKGSIKQQRASFKAFWQKIKMRWRRLPADPNTGKRLYNLEMRSAGNYGFLDEEETQKVQIYYYITNLWNARLIVNQR